MYRRRDTLQPRGGGGRTVRVFAGPRPPSQPRRALFLDRQDPLLREVCSRSHPSRSARMATVRHALDRLRDEGTAVGVATHNRADDWEAFDADEISEMHDRIEQVLGPIALWCVCRVSASGSCACSAPELGVVTTGAEAIGVDVADCSVATRSARMAAAAARAGAPNLLASALPEVGGAAGVGGSPAGDDRMIEAEVLSRAVDALIARDAPKS